METPKKKKIFALFFGGEIYDWEQESSFFLQDLKKLNIKNIQ